VLGAAALVIVWVTLVSRSAPGAVSWSDADTRTALNAELGLSRGDGFYLVVSVGGGEMSLKCKGAVVETYPILGCELGRPRSWFLPGRVPDGWKGQVWTEARLDPPRRSPAAVRGNGGSPSELVPPTPEEAYPAPSRWAVRFREKAVLEIAGREAVGKKRHVPGSPPLPGGTIGVRITLDRPVADRLYRGLPEGTSVILGP
jgi:hypothetical protein